ncbi:MAG: hypothetical protein JNG85_09660 [Spirochaetaceae bacterium]|nr:hypothetical protein [Spirochaetaceae bacterium]
MRTSQLAFSLLYLSSTLLFAQEIPESATPIATAEALSAASTPAADPEPAPEPAAPVPSPEPAAPAPRFLNNPRLGVGLSFDLPVGRYRGYAVSGGGLSLELAARIANSPIELGLTAGFDLLASGNPYIESLLRGHALLRSGWRFPLPAAKLSLVPRLGAGLVVHLARASLNELETAVTWIAYADQFYSAELALDFGPGGRGSRWSLVLAPGIRLFPSRAYWGFQAGIEAGARLKLGR